MASQGAYGAGFVFTLLWKPVALCWDTCSSLLPCVALCLLCGWQLLDLSARFSGDPLLPPISHYSPHQSHQQTAPHLAGDVLLGPGPAWSGSWDSPSHQTKIPSPDPLPLGLSFSWFPCFVVGEVPSLVTAEPVTWEGPFETLTIWSY